jgi:glucose-1-phosphate cytidylyltransferase
MKVVILAGGYGTRISEETDTRPKPMVEIGGKPILWHLMKIYSQYGYNEFIICLGYKGYFIKEYFANYFLHQSDLTIDLKDNSRQVHNNASENWKITLVDTGLNTMTGGRIKRIQKYVGNEPFLLTYGDGLSNVNITNLVENHKYSGKKCTVTGIRPKGRFGLLQVGTNNDVLSFAEKKDEDNSLINGGYFVCEPSVFDYIKEEDDKAIWEKDPLESLAQDGQLNLNFHDGFWKPMDSLKDKMDLNELWNAGNADWKIWK